MIAADFPTSEKRLAEALGVARKVVQGVRQDYLTKGTHWIYVDSGAVHYSQAGVDAAMARLGVKPEKIAPAEPDSAANAGPAIALEAPEVAEVVISRCFSVNRRLVEARKGEERVRVRVRSNEKMRPGQILRVVCVEDDLYELAERLPTRKGQQ